MVSHKGLSIDFSRIMTFDCEFNWVKKLYISLVIETLLLMETLTNLMRTYNQACLSQTESGMQQHSLIEIVVLEPPVLSYYT